MPYITKERKNQLQSSQPYCAGDLNYLISCICDNFMTRKGKSYATINEIVGALECCKLEFYRRIAAPYEDLKIQTNGDVYHEINLPS